MPPRFDTRSFRKRHGLTQEQLAARIPVDVRTVQKWESETQIVDPSPLARRRLLELEVETERRTQRRRGGVGDATH